MFRFAASITMMGDSDRINSQINKTNRKRGNMDEFKRESKNICSNGGDFITDFSGNSLLRLCGDGRCCVRVDRNCDNIVFICTERPGHTVQRDGLCELK